MDRPTGSLDGQRARRFLHDLKAAPFIALVFEDGQVRVYTKGLDAEHMAAVQEFVEQFSVADEGVGA